MKNRRTASPKSSRNTDRNRLDIAAEAARIMATEGQKNYLTAKQKAAARLGITQRSALPSNADVEDALKTWQRLYGGEDHAKCLSDLRELAVEAMAFLKPFKPRLVGPVLEGTADQFSRVCLHLFTDDPDGPVHFLMQHDIPFTQERRRVRWHRDVFREIDVLVIDQDGDVVECSVMVGPDGKHTPPSPITGEPMARATLGEVRALLACQD